MLDNTAPIPQTIFSVSELNFATKRCLEEGFSHIWVRGEIADFKRHYSGHTYFSLKDGGAQIRCALFKSRFGSNPASTTELNSGMQVLVCAKVSIYPDKGDYQLIVSSIIPEGEGQLQLAFNALKKSLAARGWFDTARKRALPRLPKRIGVVTSPTGAAIRDVLTVLKRRCPAIPVVLYPTAVQGSAAAANIALAIALANQHAACDVLIVTRGGGSLEDLWPFNEAVVAEAIFNSGIPVVSAVGHEIDFTIADFVADLRAATPSAAAEMVSPDDTQLKNRLRHLVIQIYKLVQDKLLYHGQQNDWLQQRLLRAHPAAQLQQQQAHLARTFTALERAMLQRLKQCQQRWQLCTQQLDTLSPLATLSRGYTITRDTETQGVLHSMATLSIEQTLDIQFSDGKVVATVTQLIPT